MSFHLVVTELFSITGRGLVAVGVVEGAPVAVGQEIRVVPPGGEEFTTTVTGIEVFRAHQPQAEPGESVGLLLRGTTREQVPVGTVLEAVMADVEPTPEPQRGLADLRLAARETHLPLLLLPVRIETSFHGHELRIRVFPDQIHVDSLDQRLTEDEVAAAHAYLEALDSGTDPVEAHADLRSTVDPSRAAVVAEEAAKVGRSGLVTEDFGALDRRAVARGLPHHLIAHGRCGDRTFTVEGRPIPAEVPIAPAAGDDVRPGTGGPLAWMVDFAVAEEVGLGLTMEVDDAARVDGLDWLYVFGVDAEGAGQHQFAELVRAHALTDGAITVAPLTPTKGTSGTAPPWPADPGGSTLDRLRRAVGLEEDLALSGPPAPDADALTSALALVSWEAALRPALAELYGMTGATLDRVREIFVRRLHPFGPYPVLQIGEQPYATAPVLARRSASGDHELGLVGAMIRTALPSLVDSADADRDKARAEGGYPWMLDTLHRSPIGQQWRLRTLTAAEAYLTPLARGRGSAAAERVARALAHGLRSAQRLLADLGVRVDPAARVVNAVGDRATPRVCGPLVAPAAHAPASAVADTGIEQLLTGPWFWAERRDPTVKDAPTSDPEPLLRLFAENAVLQVLAEVVIVEDLTEERDLVRALNSGRGLLTAGVAGLRGRLAQEAERLAGGVAPDLGATLRPRTEQGRQRLRDLAALCEALARVNEAPAGAVHAAFAVVLDCLTTRSDAWLMAEAQSVLADSYPGHHGVSLGAWGVVQNVRPRAGEAPTLHGTAPSQELATALGLLHRARRGLTGTGLEAVARADLSGPRVADAREVLGRLAQGTSIETALSQRIAELLDEAGRGPVMAAVEQALPASTGAATGCDGLAFLEHPDLAVPGLDDPDLALLRQIQAALWSAMDTIAALHLTDGATAVAHHRVEAAQATLDALSAGSPPPADMAAATPATTGTSLSFTVAACAGVAEIPTGTLDIRSRLAPGLAVLAERLCGPLRGALRLGDAAPVPLEELGLSALALAYLAGPGTDALGRLRSYARAVLDLPDDVQIEPDDTARATLWAAGRVAALLYEARALTADDFPDDARITQDSAATAQVRDRATTVLRELRDELTTGEAGAPLAAGLFAAGLLPVPEPERIGEALTEIDARLTRAAAAATVGEAVQTLLGDIPATEVLRPNSPDRWPDPPQGTTPMELTVWLEESQAVRSRLEAVADLLLGTPSVPLRADQWPQPGGAPTSWIGREGAADTDQTARSSLVTLGTDIASQAGFCGLLLDSWQEVVPSDVVTLGVAVESPSPKSRPPHLIVLGVPPDPAMPWTPTAVLETLEHTVAVARARTISLGSLPAATAGNGPLGRLGHLLPLGAVRPGDTALSRAACETTEV